jgi:N-methylhydantoinase B
MDASSSAVQFSTGDLDPVTFELLRYNVDAVNDDMLLTILRTAHTGIIRDSLDVSVAICDPAGAMVAQGFCIPLHLGAIPDAMDEIVARFRDDVRPGDVFILNEPYKGGMHLPDIFLFQPVFVNGVLLAYLVIICDYGDMGGRVPGGRPLDAKSVFEEGLRIPPLKYVEAGRPVSAIKEIIGQNVRLPGQTLADLDSCMAAFRSAEALFLSIVQKFGVDAVRRFFSQVMDYSERLARGTIASLPDGKYEFTDYLDDSIVLSDPVVIHCVLEVRGDQILVDFEGSSSQVPASINCTLSWTKSSVYAAVRTLLPAHMPNNSGAFRAIAVSAPKGSVLNPHEPAPVAERGVTGFRIVDCVLGALAQVTPDMATAAGEGGATGLRFAGQNRDHSQFIVFDSVMGTWGAGPDRDGLDGCSNFAGNASNRPVEVIEAEGHVRVLQYSFRIDSGGPGKYRGGLGLNREWEVLADEVMMSIRADRTKFQPWGLHSGLPGALSRNVLNPQGAFEVLPAKLHRTLRKGDRLLHEQASGGGYGDPFDRDPELVLRDVRDEKVTVQHALAAYGVVIDPEQKRVDIQATAATRAKQKDAESVVE